MIVYDCPACEEGVEREDALRGYCANCEYELPVRFRVVKSRGRWWVLDTDRDDLPYLSRSDINDAYSEAAELNRQAEAESRCGGR